MLILSLTHPLSVCVRYKENFSSATTPQSKYLSHFLLKPRRDHPRTSTRHPRRASPLHQISHSCQPANHVLSVLPSARQYLIKANSNITIAVELNRENQQTGTKSMKGSLSQPAQQLSSLRTVQYHRWNQHATQELPAVNSSLPTEPQSSLMTSFTLTGTAGFYKQKVQERD